MSKRAQRPDPERLAALYRQHGRDGVAMILACGSEMVTKWLREDGLVEIQPPGRRRTPWRTASQSLGHYEGLEGRTR